MKEIILNRKIIVILTDDNYEKVIDHINKPQLMEFGYSVSCKCTLRFFNNKNKKIKNCIITVNNTGMHLGYSLKQKNKF